MHKILVTGKRFSDSFGDMDPPVDLSEKTRFYSRFPYLLFSRKLLILCNAFVTDVLGIILFVVILSVTKFVN